MKIEYGLTTNEVEVPKNHQFYLKNGLRCRLLLLLIQQTPTH